MFIVVFLLRKMPYTTANPPSAVKGLTMREIFNLARSRTKHKLGFDITLPSSKLIAASMASECDKADTFIMRDMSFVRLSSQFGRTLTRTTSNSAIFRHKFLIAYRAIVRWAFGIFTRRKNQSGNLRLSIATMFLSMTFFAKQNKIIIAIVKMVSIFMVNFKIARATTVLAMNISSFYKFLQRMWVSIVKFAFFPIRIISADKMLFLIGSFACDRAKGTRNRRLIIYRFTALFADTCFKGFVEFIKSPLWSTHNEIIAHATQYSKSVNTSKGMKYALSNSC